MSSSRSSMTKSQSEPRLLSPDDPQVHLSVMSSFTSTSPDVCALHIFHKCYQPDTMDIQFQSTFQRLHSQTTAKSDPIAGCRLNFIWSSLYGLDPIDYVPKELKSAFQNQLRDDKKMYVISANTKWKANQKPGVGDTASWSTFNQQVEILYGTLDTVLKNHGGASGSNQRGLQLSKKQITDAFGHRLIDGEKALTTRSHSTGAITDSFRGNDQVEMPSRKSKSDTTPTRESSASSSAELPGRKPPPKPQSGRPPRPPAKRAQVPADRGSTVPNLPFQRAKGQKASSSNVPVRQVVGWKVATGPGSYSNKTLNRSQLTQSLSQPQLATHPEEMPIRNSQSAPSSRQHSS